MSCYLSAISCSCLTNRNSSSFREMLGYLSLAFRWAFNCPKLSNWDDFSRPQHGGRLRAAGGDRRPRTQRLRRRPGLGLHDRLGHLLLPADRAQLAQEEVRPGPALLRDGSSHSYLPKMLVLLGMILFAFFIRIKLHTFFFGNHSS